MFLLLLLLLFATIIGVKKIEHSFQGNIQHKPQILDRDGNWLSVSYSEMLNNSNQLKLEEIPEFLQQAFIFSEDKNFYQHAGSDWMAKLEAVKQNLLHQKVVRGASTITEQAIKIASQNKRNIWSKWLEIFVAKRLEEKFSKRQILEFYLNQIPYSGNRRGVEQAARFYFNRNVVSLSKKEMLALVVLVRAPSAFDLYKNPKIIDGRINQLATAMFGEVESKKIMQQELVFEKPKLAIEAPQFIHFIRQKYSHLNQSKIRTTLDSTIQDYASSALNEALKSLKKYQVHDAALVVLDHRDNSLIAFVTASTDKKDINSVVTPRQPASALKPFLYALALSDNRLNAATLIDDEPFLAQVGSGAHKFKNYSNNFYGKITLREALGNSLNIAAVKLIDHVGVKNYLTKLHELGFNSLNNDYNFYGSGLALGNGEVTLLEMANAYSALANCGTYRNIKFLFDDNISENKTVFSCETSSLVANILSDPWARRLEFDVGGVLDLPIQTAVKTGTATNFVDSWAMGFDQRYVVGVWMGNLDRKPTQGLTGATGPAMILRNVFHRLNQNQQPLPLYLSKKLFRRQICIDYQDGESCVPRHEFFIEQDTTTSDNILQKDQIYKPSENLRIAYNPRIPLEKQHFEFLIKSSRDIKNVTWMLNGKVIATTEGKSFLWQIAAGRQHLEVIITTKDDTKITLKPVDFTVRF